MSTATCGHEVKDGIMVTYKSIDREGENCSVYACYCVNCTLELFEDGRLEGDLAKLIEKAKRETLTEVKRLVDGL